METAKTTSGANYDSLVAESARERIRKAFKRLAGKVEAIARWPLRRIGPRVSLVTGGVFVLFTLYLSTAAWGLIWEARQGIDLARGDSDYFWVSGLFLFRPASSRSFYLVCLALAAFTILIAVASRIRPGITRQGTLVKTLFATSAVVALFSTTDLFCIRCLGLMDSLLQWANLSEEVAGMISIGILFLLTVACLRRDFWTTRGAPVWMTITGGFISLMYLYVRFFSGHFQYFDDYHVVPLLNFGAFSLLPLYLWFRYWLSRRKASCVSWPAMKKRLSAFYAITGAFDLVFFAMVGEDEWGLLAFIVGVYLMFFGYWKLWREASAQQPVLSSASAGTDKRLASDTQ